MFLRSILLCVLAMILGGCASVDREQMRTEAKNLMDSRVSRLKSDPLLLNMSTKLWFGPTRQMPLEYFDNKSIVVDSEKVAVNRLHEWNLIFANETQEFIVKYNLPYLDLLSLSRAAHATLVADLYLGKITYGDFSRRTHELSITFDRAMLNRDAEMARQAKVDQSIALQNLGNYLNQQQLINAMNQPARIAPFSCNKMGSTINCW